ncbi:MAG: hypothetical protein V1663_00940 [archaeon]
MPNPRTKSLSKEELYALSATLVGSSYDQMLDVERTYDLKN